MNLLIAATVSVGLAGCGSDSPSSQPKPAGAGIEVSGSADGDADIQITSPDTNAKVPHEQKVTGTAGAIPDGQNLWIFTVTKAENKEKYAPQSDVIDVQPDGSWTQTAYVGSRDATTAGKEYKIAIYLVPTAESSAIEAYLKDSAKTGQYPGFNPPAGATEAASVTVVRE